MELLSNDSSAIDQLRKIANEPVQRIYHVITNFNGKQCVHQTLIGVETGKDAAQMLVDMGLPITVTPPIEPSPTGE